MANVDPFRDDPGRSVRLNFDLSLNDDFTLLVDSLAGEVIKFHELDEPRPITVNQINAALSYVLANLLHANQLSPQCYVAISMRPGSYTRSRYLPSSIGYDNLVRVIRYLTDTDPPFASFVRGFHDRRQRELRGRTSRVRATTRLLDLFKGYTQLQLERGLNKDDKTNRNNKEDNTKIEKLLTELIERTSDHPSTTPAITGRISLSPTAVTSSPSSDCIRLKDRDGRLIDYRLIRDGGPAVGKSPMMASWKGILSDQQIWDLITYIRSLAE